MYIYTYIHTYIYIYIYIYETKTFIYPTVIFRFLSNLQRLNKITKGVKGINLKTNYNRTKE